MHKVDLTQTIKDWDGAPIRIDVAACQACGRPEEQRELALREVLQNALGAQYRDEVGLEAGKKYERMDLGMRVQRRKQFIEFTPEEIVLLKNLVNKFYLSPLIVTQAHRMIDPSLKAPDYGEEE